MMASLDVYRPAAQEQLKLLGEKNNINTLCINMRICKIEDYKLPKSDLNILEKQNYEQVSDNKIFIDRMSCLLIAFSALHVFFQLLFKRAAKLHKKQLLLFIYCGSLLLQVYNYLFNR